jgi:hypothetical protein
MIRIVNLGLISVVIISFVCTTAASSNEVTDPSTTLLRDNWFIQPSADGPADGAAISAVGFPTRGWYPATLPSTVLSALVEDKVYPDPYTGMNLRSIPGTTYPIFEDFSNIPMPPNSPFRQPWWFRTEFKLPTEYSGKSLWLGFDGINYRANVWMNGVQIASSLPQVSDASAPALTGGPRTGTPDHQLIPCRVHWTFARSSSLDPPALSLSSYP